MNVDNTVAQVLVAGATASSFREAPREADGPREQFGCAMPPAVYGRALPPAVYGRCAWLGARGASGVQLALWAKAVGLAVWLSQTNSLLRALLPSFYARMTSADCEQVVPAGSHAQVEQTWNEDSRHNDIAVSLCRLDLEGVTMVGVREVNSGHNDLADRLSRLDWVDDYSHLRAAVEGAGGEGEHGHSPMVVVREGNSGHNDIADSSSRLDVEEERSEGGSRSEGGGALGSRSEGGGALGGRD